MSTDNLCLAKTFRSAFDAQSMADIIWRRFPIVCRLDLRYVEREETRKPPPRVATRGLFAVFRDAGQL